MLIVYDAYRFCLHRVRFVSQGAANVTYLRMRSGQGFNEGARSQSIKSKWIPWCLRDESLDSLVTLKDAPPNKSNRCTAFVSNAACQPSCKPSYQCLAFSGEWRICVCFSLAKEVPPLLSCQFLRPSICGRQHPGMWMNINSFHLDDPHQRTETSLVRQK